MSMEIEDRCSAEEQELDGSTEEVHKESKITYTRAFLISFSELDVCKELPGGIELSVLRKLKYSYTRDFLLCFSELLICATLPNGFDPSILCEMNDASGSITDNQKIPGSVALSCSRDPSGRSWRSSESGGIMGTGDVPRVSPGVSPPNIQDNSRYLLKKSDNPYIPPRSSKVGINQEHETRRIISSPRDDDNNKIMNPSLADESSSEVIPSMTMAIWGQEHYEANGAGVVTSSPIEGDTRQNQNNKFLDYKTSLLVEEHSPDNFTETISKFCGFPFLVEDDHFFTSILGKSGIIESNSKPNSKPTNKIKNCKIDEYDETWAEILEIIQLEQQEPKLTPSEVEICLPDEDSLIVVDDLISPQCSNALNSSPAIVDTVDIAKGSVSLQLYKAAHSLEFVKVEAKKKDPKRSLGQLVRYSPIEYRVFGMPYSGNTEEAKIFRKEVGAKCTFGATIEDQENYYNQQQLGDDFFY